ncbi:MAG: DUF1799 domain-containing protein [Pseudomonadota bacterium]
MAGKDALEEDIAAWGLPVDISDLKSEDAFEGLWDRYVPALDAFLAVSSQWVRDAMGHFTGLNYAGVEPGLRMAGIEISPDVFAELREIEAGARARLNQGTSGD